MLTNTFQLAQRTPGQPGRHSIGRILSLCTQPGWPVKSEHAGNIITEGCLMAEELNVHFSSVFTREDTSSLPVPETKFNGSEEEKLGQLLT